MPDPDEKQDKGAKAPSAAKDPVKEPPAPSGGGSSPDPDPAPAAPETDEETRYTRDELRASAHAITGYSWIAVAGGLAGDDRQSFTAEQAKEAAAAYLKGEQ